MVKRLSDEEFWNKVADIVGDPRLKRKRGEVNKCQDMDFFVVKTVKKH